MKNTAYVLGLLLGVTHAFATTHDFNDQEKGEFESLNLSGAKLFVEKGKAEVIDHLSKKDFKRAVHVSGGNPNYGFRF